MLSVGIYFSWHILGNTRVISQSSLQTFQEEMGKALKDPYKVCSVENPMVRMCETYMDLVCLVDHV